MNSFLAYSISRDQKELFLDLVEFGRQVTLFSRPLLSCDVEVFGHLANKCGRDRMERLAYLQDLSVSD